MSNLVEKLRTLADPNISFCLGDLWNGLDEAADEIERLRAELVLEREKSSRIERETIERCVARLKETFSISITPAAYRNKTWEQFVDAAVRVLREKE